MPDRSQEVRSESSARPRWGVWAVRIVVTVIVALLIGSAASAATRWDSKLSETPGFGRGMLHGVLMPVAWPTLLAGHDQIIYAERNSGRTYKLGYSMGVNLSGLLFFGWFFMRLRRWSRPANC